MAKEPNLFDDDEQRCCQCSPECRMSLEGFHGNTKIHPDHRKKWDEKIRQEKARDKAEKKANKIETAYQKSKSRNPKRLPTFIKIAETFQRGGHYISPRAIEDLMIYFPSLSDFDWGCIKSCLQEYYQSTNGNLGMNHNHTKLVKRDAVKQCPELEGFFEERKT